MLWVFIETILMNTRVIRYTASFFQAEALLLSWRCQHHILDCTVFIWKGRLGFSSVNFSSLNLIKINLISRDFLNIFLAFG